MARRSVTATFAGGMISDEFKPGTARYLENMVPHGIDGVVPAGPARETSFAITAMSGSSGSWGSLTATGGFELGWTSATGRNVAVGWHRGGTWHPKNGFVGIQSMALCDLTVATGSIQAEVLASSTSFGAALMRSTSNTFLFSQSGYCAPVAGPFVRSTSTTALTASFSEYLAYPRSRPIYVNTEDETLIVNGYGAHRYAGGSWATGQGFHITAGSAACSGVTGFCAPGSVTTYVTGQYTDIVDVYGSQDLFFSGTTPRGNYICIGMGVSVDAAQGTSTSTAAHQIHSFLVTELVASSTGAGAPFKVRIDGKIMAEATAMYFKFIASPIATISVNQVSREERQQPWGTLVNTYPTYGFSNTIGAENPPLSPRGQAACYHGGRLFVGEEDTIRWSGTVDETVELTDYTFSAATSTAASADMNSAPTPIGVQFSHFKLWSTAGYLPIFGGIGRGIVGLASLGDELVIMKRGGLFRMVGGVSYDGSSNSLDLQVISDSIGPDSTAAWAKTERGIIFTCGDTIWLYDGNELRDISSGSISLAFRENILHDRMRNGYQLPVKVTAGGGNVFFTQEYDGNDLLNYITLGGAGGGTKYNKHLVLDLRSETWTFVDNDQMNIPAAIIDADGSGDTKGAGLLYLNSWRPYDYYGTLADWYNSVSFVDMKNVFHRDGIFNKTQGVFIGATGYSKLVSCNDAHIITHPLSGYGSMEPIRPRSLLLKRTLAATSTGVSNRSAASSTAHDASRLFIHDSEAGFSPTIYSSPSNNVNPAWWSPHQEAESTAAVTPSIDNHTAEVSNGWDPRSHWSAGTSTSIAISTIDKVVLDNIRSSMSAPSIHYRDNCWTRTGATRYYESHIIHALCLEYDDVENRTDR